MNAFQDSGSKESVLKVESKGGKYLAFVPFYLLALVFGLVVLTFDV